MNVGDERSVSFWSDIDVIPEAGPLAGNETTDVVVVGSGIAGLSTAYELTRRGYSVVILDRGKIAKGMTARTTAHLSAISDDSFDGLSKLRGEESARAFYESHGTAIDRIEAIVEREAIVCDFRRTDGYLFPALGESASELESEYDAARKLGVAVEWHQGLPFDGFGGTRCLRYPRQATFHPLRYLRGVAEKIRESGGRFFADTRVDAVEEGAGGVTVRTQFGHSVHARYTVIATNSPINDLVAIHTKQAPYRTYAMALDMPNAIEDALYWDTLDPYHYIRLQPGRGGQHLIVGGEDHKTGTADDAMRRFEALEEWIRGLLPNLGGVTHRWSGQVMEPIDYAAFIGRNAGNTNVYVATGDSGQGITHGVVASLVLTAQIAGEAAAWSAFYAPDRITPAAAKNFIAENVGVLKNFADYVAPGEIDSADLLKPGEGAIVREGLRKVAAFRDDAGRLHRCSAACTHIGCHVHWNSFERCWDCPCHGSQFAVDGTALNAPAIAPLKRAD